MSRLTPCAFRSSVPATLVFVAALAAPSCAGACPNGAAGRQARGEVLRDDFAFHLIAALAPFLVIGGICVRVETRGRRGRS
jgi:hypothetical protein